MRKKRHNASGAVVPFADIDSEREKLPSSAVDLTTAERRILEDPDWIDEDEADAIISLRILRQEGHTAIPIEEYSKRRGRTLED